MTTMTEDEARGKWCPMARLSVGDWNRGIAAINRGTTANRDSHALCIASACMAWRWKPTPSGATPSDRGYCGAFGRPEE